MSRYLGVAKAAKLLGVPRENLQKMIRRGELATFEGQVDVELLRQRFPALAIDESSALERTQIIRDSAYAKRVAETVTPSKDSLQSQIRRLKVELSIAKVKERSYRKLFNDLLDALTQLQGGEREGEDRLLQELNTWLLQRIKAAETYLAKSSDESPDHVTSE
ncbi:hypothetical protein [Kaarinaea lacus]